MCLHDVLFKMNIMPHSDDPTTNAYSMWYDKPYDMKKQPILDFGCIVMAHIPLKDQGMLTGRATETYYVGPHDNGRHGGLLLYNPITKHTIVRRTFRVMGPIRQDSPQLTYEAAYEDIGDTTTFVTDTGSKVTLLPQPTDDVPYLVDDSDSDDDGDVLNLNRPAENGVNQYGNDFCIENDPIPTGSDRKLQRHQPIVLLRRT